MDRSRFRIGSAVALAFTLSALALPARSAAQQHDFLFRTPRVSLGVRGGYALPTVSSDIFDFTRDQLTVSRSDFNAAAWGLELAVRASDRVDIAFDLGYARSNTRSEFRDYVDNNDLPIEQTTEFRRVPFTVNAKVYLRDRGRSVGRFAWIPYRWTPFVGGGVGTMWYRFEQNGDWIDFNTMEVFPDTWISDGRAPALDVFGGTDMSLGPSFFVTFEGRYTWAKADMSQDFVDFNKVDLSGFQATAGISVRF
ncbi:MAG: outer membrane beta-barrel protein [Gemmatimonadota bacterium]|jgi:hypothetical protein